MKTATLRTFLAVHTWVGLVAGMALFIAFYAGAITVFSHELGDWNRSGRAAIEPADPVARSQALLDAVLREHPQAAESLYLVLPGDHGPQPSAYWFESAGGKSRRFAFANADSEQVQEVPEREGFVDYFRSATPVDVVVQSTAQPTTVKTKPAASRCAGVTRSDRGPTMTRMSVMPATSPAVAAAAMPAPAPVRSMSSAVDQ